MVHSTFVCGRTIEPTDDVKSNEIKAHKNNYNKNTYNKSD